MAEADGDERVGGDKFVVGDIEHATGVAIGAGAQAIVQKITTVIQQPLSPVDEAEKARLLARQRLAEAVRDYAQSLSQRGSDEHDADQGGPYRGLYAYTLDDSEIFFGRQRALQELWEHIHQSRLTILHSESGAGKSSLLQAGIEAQILIKQHLPVYVRTFDRPAIRLKRNLFPTYARVAELKDYSLHEFLSEVTQILGRSTTLYLMFDQFEEFFTQIQDEPTRDGFVGELAECYYDQNLNLRIILALRSEFFGEIAAFTPHIQKPFDNQYRLKRLTSEEARSVIIEPAQRHQLEIETRLVDVVLADLRQGDGEIAPPQLQLVCQALYEAYRDQVKQEPILAKRITLDLYNNENRAQGILSRYLERVLTRRLRKPEERELARRLLVELISSDERRLRLRHSELARRLATAAPVSQNLNAAVLKRILQVLVNSTMLISDQQDDDDEATYELAHDYLIGAIKVDPDVQTRKVAQELLEREVESHRRFDTLLSVDKYQIIDSQRTFLRIDETAAILLKDSYEKLEKERQAKEADLAEKLRQTEQIARYEMQQSRLKTRVIRILSLILALIFLYGAFLVSGQLILRTSHWRKITSFPQTWVLTLDAVVTDGQTPIYCAGTSTIGVGCSRNGRSWNIYQQGFAVGQSGPDEESPFAGDIRAVSAVAIDPANIQTMYAALFDGLIYKSSDEGITWQAISDSSESFPRIHKIRVYDRLVIALSGDGSTDGKTALNISKDAGMTWFDASSNSGDLPMRINDFEVSQDRDQIYIVTDMGLYGRGIKDTDSWEQLLQLPQAYLIEGSLYADKTYLVTFDGTTANGTLFTWTIANSIEKVGDFSGKPIALTLAPLRNQIESVYLLLDTGNIVRFDPNSKEVSMFTDLPKLFFGPAFDLLAVPYYQDDSIQLLLGRASGLFEYVIP